MCGRADFVREIVDNCRAERFTVLTSEPGMGVSSLLHAGVAPALLREGFIVARFSDWPDKSFALNLKETIAEAVRDEIDPLFYPRNESLDDLLNHIRARTHTPIAILLDHFDDYIRCNVNTVASDLFDAELAHAVSSRSGVFVIGLQEHAVPALERLSQHIPNLLGFQVRLQPLGIEAAKEAVLSEASGRGFDVEPAAMDNLLASHVVVPEANKVNPFFLKVATGILLDAETLLQSKSLRASTIEAHGGVERIVMESLDGQIAELSGTQRDLLFRWCAILISPEQHRLSVTSKGLTDYAGKLNRFVPPLLQRLMETGLLRSIETSGTLRYEISRECLVPILRDWWERREAVIVARRRAAFRIRSISVAVSALILTYVIWLLFGTK